MYLKFSFEKSTLAHGLFRTVSFSFHVFGDFSVVFLLPISNLIPFLVREVILLNFNSFELIKVYFVTRI